MTEIEQLREEVAELRKALTERSTPPLPSFAVDNPSSPHIDNHELVTDLTRFDSGLPLSAYEVPHRFWCLGSVRDIRAPLARLSDRGRGPTPRPGSSGHGQILDNRVGQLQSKTGSHANRQPDQKNCRQMCSARTRKNSVLG